MMSSTTRLSYSVVVLMLEASNSFNLAIPMIIAVFTAKMVGDIFTVSLYERELRDENIPLLTGSCPMRTRTKKACEIMAKNPITVTTLCEMPQIQKALDSDHSAFPVLNTAGHLVGLISKHMIAILTENKCWYETSRLSMATRTRAKEAKMKSLDDTQDLLEKLQILNEQNEKFDTNFDETEGFPPTPDDKIMSKIHFNSPITGKQPDYERILNEVCDHYLEEMVDLRPYMWEYPFTVTIHDTLEKCLNIFLNNHLRHLPVVNPVDGACVGVITRKDLFAYCDMTSD